MRSHSFWSCLAVLALAAGVQADDTYTIKLKHEPDVGKTVTVTSSDTETASNKVTDADGNVLDDGKKHTEKTDQVYAETVLEKGEKGANKYKRTYEKATRTRDGKAESRSYQGRTLVFEKKDGKYSVTPEGDKPVSKEDLAELTKKANEGNDAQDVLFLPSKPVKVGDTWKVEGKKLAEAFPTGGQLDIEHSGGEAKLTKVYKKDGHQFGTMVLALKMAFKTPKEVTYEKPPVVEMKITLDTAIDGSSTAGVMTGTGSAATKGTVEQNGKKLTVEATFELSGRKEQSAEK